jgi:dTMP kinase
MKFVVIEGLDGSGKSTQIKLLRNYLEENKIAYQYLHFPRTDSPVYGELIARFLRGELGENNIVNPYLIALIYAGDRTDASEMIREWIKKDYFVLVDRYVFSNIAFQGAKLHTQDDRNKLKEWIINLEYGYNKIPVPDINIFLDVPFEFTAKQLTNSRRGEDRNYLLGNRDIHEDDLDFQKRVREIYFSLVPYHKDFTIIDCSSLTGKMMTADLIFKKIQTIIFS